jgi:proton-translocating NADH-quinone oxidoreductase chain N
MLLTTGDNTRSVFVLTGLAMTVTGIGFKLAVVPFHMWTPDVYEGAPAPVTAFVATVSKGAIVALLLRYVVQTRAYPYGSLLLAFSVLAGASIVVGNLLALLQENVKRVLAYSSIAHLGYLLVALVAGGPRGVEAATYYLVAYMLTTLSAFGSVIVLSEKEQDAENMAAYRGLFWRRPWLAMVFTAALLSLAGIPLTAGFVGKFYVLLVGVESALWPLIFLLVFGSAVGLFLLPAPRSGHVRLPSRGPGRPCHEARAVAVVRYYPDAYGSHHWRGMAGSLSCATDPHHSADGGQSLVRRCKAMVDVGIARRPHMPDRSP